MVTRHSRHGHKAPRQASINIASDENVTEDFFSGLVNLLDICEYHSLNDDLDFPSAAILFNQLDITVSVLRSVSDCVANLPCTDQLQELCSCFSEIHLYWWNRMAEIGRRTTSGVGRPKFEIAQERLQKPNSSRLHMDANSSHAASFPMDHSTESGGVWITLRKGV